MTETHKVTLRMLLSTTMLLCLVAMAHGMPCGFTDETTGQLWDLSPMTRVGSQPDYLYPPFSVNICANSRAPCQPPNAVCMANATQPSQFIGCGSVTSMKIAQQTKYSSDGVVITYPDGDGINGVARISHVYVFCNPSAGDGYITTAFQSAINVYEVHMQSRYGCQGVMPQNPLVEQFSVPVMAWGYLPSSPTYFSRRTEQSTANGTLYFDQVNGIAKFNATVVKPDVDSGKLAGFMMVGTQKLKVSMPLSQQCDVEKTRHKLALLNTAAPRFLGYQSYTSLFFNQGQKINVTTWGEVTGTKVLLKLDAKTNALVWADGHLLDANANNVPGFLGEAYQVEADWNRFAPSLPPAIFSVPAAWNCLN